MKIQACRYDGVPDFGTCRPCGGARLLEPAGQRVIRPEPACRGYALRKHLGHRRRQQHGGQGEQLVQLVLRRVRGNEPAGVGEELSLLSGQVNGSAHGNILQPGRGRLHAGGGAARATGGRWGRRRRQLTELN